MNLFKSISTVQTLAQAAALLAAATVTSAHAFDIQINGNVSQAATTNNTAFTAVASGVKAKAVNQVNAITGSVGINGNVSQTADLKNTVLTSVATGVGADAGNHINAINGGSN